MDSMSDEQLAAWAIAERQKEVAGDERALQDEMLVDIDGIQGETGPRILGVPENGPFSPIYFIHAAERGIQRS